MIVNPSAVYGPGPWAAAGCRRRAARRDPRPPAGRPPGRDDARVRRRRRRRPPRRVRPRPARRALHPRRTASRRIASCAEAAVDAAGRGRVPPTLPAPVARVARDGRRGGGARDPRPPLLGRGQLHFLLWQARADSAKARDELGFDATPWQRGHPAHRALDARQRARLSVQRPGCPSAAASAAGHPIDLLLAHRGEERQAEGPLGEPLRNRELTPGEPESLAVEGIRWMHGR